MIELKHALLAEQALVNQLTGGQLSIINLINAINVPSLPQNINTFYLVLNWQRDREEKAEEVTFETRIYVEDDNEPVINSKEHPPISVKIPRGEYIVNTVGKIAFKIIKPDENRIVIERKVEGEWKRVGDISIEVIVTHEK